MAPDRHGCYRILILIRLQSRPLYFFSLYVACHFVGLLFHFFHLSVFLSFFIYLPCFSSSCHLYRMESLHLIFLGIHHFYFFIFCSIQSIFLVWVSIAFSAKNDSRLVSHLSNLFSVLFSLHVVFSYLSVLSYLHSLVFLVFFSVLLFLVIFMSSSFYQSSISISYLLWIK